MLDGACGVRSCSKGREFQMTKHLSPAQIFMDSRHICQMNKIVVTSSKYVISQLRRLFWIFTISFFVFCTFYYSISLTTTVFGTFSSGL